MGLQIALMMQSHTGCICLTFSHCAFSDVSSNDLHVRMHSHTGCICSICFYPFSLLQKLLPWYNYFSHHCFQVVYPLQLVSSFGEDLFQTENKFRLRFTYGPIEQKLKVKRNSPGI